MFKKKLTNIILQKPYLQLFKKKPRKIKRGFEYLYCVAILLKLSATTATN